MKEPKITAEEFLKRGKADKLGMYIGNLCGTSKCVKLIENLLLAGFNLRFLDNNRQEGYSDTMWVKAKNNSNIHMNASLFCELMLLKPDECTVEKDGWIRLWWD